MTVRYSLDPTERSMRNSVKDERAPHAFDEARSKRFESGHILSALRSGEQELATLAPTLSRSFLSSSR